MASGLHLPPEGRSPETEPPSVHPSRTRNDADTHTEPQRPSHAARRMLPHRAAHRVRVRARAFPRTLMARLAHSSHRGARRLSGRLPLRIGWPAAVRARRRPYVLRRCGTHARTECWASPCPVAARTTEPASNREASPEVGGYSDPSEPLGCWCHSVPAADRLA